MTNHRTIVGRVERIIGGRSGRDGLTTKEVARLARCSRDTAYVSLMRLRSRNPKWIKRIRIGQETLWGRA